MKYQKAIAEVIRFNECEEFMAASGEDLQTVLNNIVGQSCGSNFNPSTDNGETFYCKGYHGQTTIEIGGHTYTYDQKGNSGKWSCSTWS